MMRLLIDIGNTRVKWALLRSGSGAGAWCASDAMNNDAIESLAATWMSALQEIDGREPCGLVLISNVAGAEVAARIEAQVRSLDLASGVTIHWLISTPFLCGVTNLYREPEKLGCDRFAALIGARALMPNRSLCVVTCGTATTIDALSEKGEFLGGWILPGLGMMKNALARGTAQLPNREAAAIDNEDEVESMASSGSNTDDSASLTCSRSGRFFGDNTMSAIDNGCLVAQTSAIEQAIALQDNAHCLLSGGAARPVSTALSGAFTLVDNLVLIGLQTIAEAWMNMDKSSGRS